jgi:hypothetical protein
MDSCSTFVEGDVDEEISEQINGSSRPTTPPPMPQPEPVFTREALRRHTEHIDSLFGLWRSKGPREAPFPAAPEPPGPATPCLKLGWTAWMGNDDGKPKKKPRKHKFKVLDRATLEGKVMHMISFKQCGHETRKMECRECESAAEVEDMGVDDGCSEGKRGWDGERLYSYYSAGWK